MHQSKKKEDMIHTKLLGILNKLQLLDTVCSHNSAKILFHHIPIKNTTDQKKKKSPLSHLRSTLLCVQNIMTSSELVILIVEIKSIYDATLPFTDLYLSYQIQINKGHIYFTHCVYLPNPSTRKHCQKCSYLPQQV